MTSIAMATFNLGGLRDYTLLVQHFEPNQVAFESKEQEEEFIDDYQKLEEELGRRVNEAGLPVLFLQEVGDEARPFIQALWEDYEIVHINKDVFDSAVALKKDQFTHIRNHSVTIRITKLFQKDAAIAKAKHVQSGESITFSSAHVPGFDVQTCPKKDILEGDFYCYQLRQEVDSVRKGSTAFIGADMNAWPKLVRSNERRGRFDILKGEKGYLLRSGKATSFNPRPGEEIRLRELDYIFRLVKTDSRIKRAWSAVKNWFGNPTPAPSLLSAKLLLFNDLRYQNDSKQWPLASNFSDHSPVAVKVWLDQVFF